MDKRKAIKLMGKARRRAQEDISAHASRGGIYAAGLASEGYAGGYRDALDDAILVLDGVIPHRRSWWEELGDD